jgi:glyoxylate carboligase
MSAEPSQSGVPPRPEGRGVVIFGYPGSAVLPIYGAIFQQNAIRHILVRREKRRQCTP